MTDIAIFVLDERRFGLPLERVERAERAVAVTPLAGAPQVVAGVVDYHGRILPVIDLRRRIGMAPRPIGADDHLLVAHSATRTLALAVDSVAGVAQYRDEDCVPPPAFEPDARQADCLQAIARCGDGLVLIHDLDRFLSDGDERALARALHGQR